jgi:hypothetical protein
MLASTYTSGQSVLLLESRMVNMPDLSEPEQISEQRKVIKFWIDRCNFLEKRIEDLKQELMKVNENNER